MSKKGVNKTSGRVTIFDEKLLPKIRKYLLLGATDVQLADFLEISPSTLARWKRNYPILWQTIKSARLDADANVAHSLYKRATGYSHKAVKIFYDPQAAAREWGAYLFAVQECGDDWQKAAQIQPPTEAGIIRAEYVERYAPDLGSAIFWLTNRHPELWQNKRQFEAKVTDARHTIEWEPAEGCEPLKNPEELEKEFNDDLSSRHVTDDQQPADSPQD